MIMQKMHWTWNENCEYPGTEQTVSIYAAVQSLMAHVEWMPLSYNVNFKNSLVSAFEISYCNTLWLIMACFQQGVFV